MNNPKFELYNSGFHYRYRLKAVNGEIILSGEAYTSKQSCLKGIEAVKTNSPFDIRYMRLVGKDNSPYFNLKAANGEIIGTSEMYSSSGARDNGIESVKKTAPQAPVKDLT